MLSVAPTSGVKVPVIASKVPPVPDVLVQSPPGCSPVIIENKSIWLVEDSLTKISPLTPVFGVGRITTSMLTELPEHPLLNGVTI